MSKNKKQMVAIGMSTDEKEELKKLAEERNTTMAGLGRMALASYQEEGCNEPIIMLQFIELTQKINELQQVIPKKKYESIQKNIETIMKIKGGK